MEIVGINRDTEKQMFTILRQGKEVVLVRDKSVRKLNDSLLLELFLLAVDNNIDIVCGEYVVSGNRIKDYLNAFATRKNHNKVTWHFLKELTPKHNEYVLVCYKENGKTEYDYLMYHNIDDYKLFSGGSHDVEIEDVVAWCYIPKYE